MSDGIARDCDRSWDPCTICCCTTVVLDIRVSTGFGILVFFRSSSLTEFQIVFLVLCCYFLEINGFIRFWMASTCKSVQLMLVFLKSPFLALQF